MTDQVSVEYVGVGPKGHVVRLVEAARCKRCSKVLLSSYEPDLVDELAEVVTGELRFLPEQGIITDDAVEVLAYVQAAEDKPVVERGDRGLHIRFAPRSELFERAEGLVSDGDLWKFGAYSTLRVSPAPPYDEEQRRTLHALIGRVQVSLQEPLFFPDANLRIDWEKGRQREAALAEQILEWTGDHDRVASSLFNEIWTDRPPGALVGTYRLLELVLELHRSKRMTRVCSAEVTHPAVAREALVQSKQLLRGRVDERLR